MQIKKPEPSREFETALFARAEQLLTARREHLAAREKKIQRAVRSRKRWFTKFRELPSRLLEFFAIHPDAPAAAATFATLVLAFLALHRPHESPANFSYSDLPELPKFNDAPAHYDAQTLAERQAYEREVEDAHHKTSGGN